MLVQPNDFGVWRLDDESGENGLVSFDLIFFVGSDCWTDDR